MQAASPTGAMSDIYESRRDELGRIRESVTLHAGQCGSVAVIGGEISMLDFVGRADVFAALQPAIVTGYALDAIGQEQVEAVPPADAVDIGTVRGFTLLVTDAPASSQVTGPGLGETTCFAANGVEGSALLARGEVVQLTAFPSEDRPGGGNGPGGHGPDADGPRATRIHRPSQRRGR